MSTTAPPPIPEPPPQNGATKDHDGRTWEWFNGRWVVQPAVPAGPVTPSPPPHSTPGLDDEVAASEIPDDPHPTGGAGGRLPTNAVADMNRD